jgi:hypothetical protein
MACSTRQVREGRGGGPEGERQGFLLACKNVQRAAAAEMTPEKAKRHCHTSGRDWTTTPATPPPPFPPPTHKPSFPG